jgi:hypothetical protein
MEYKTGRFTVGDWRVLFVEWTFDAYNKLHEEYKDLIIKGFEQVGMLLNLDSFEDWKLKICDLLGLILYS